MSTIRITKQFNFETGHALYGYDGKCKNVHGHSYKLSVTVSGKPIDDNTHVKFGMVIDFGTIRVKGKGSDGGHNGLKDIQEKLGTNKYPRFRFGVGANYSKGRQVDYVLGEWTAEEESQLIERLPKSIEVVTSFGTAGLANTMNTFNGK